MADPYDGYNRSLPASPFLPPAPGRLRGADVLPRRAKHGAEVRRDPPPGAGGRRRVDVDRTPAEVAARLADPAVGWGYVDQSRFCPKLFELTELRRLMVKRPGITTTEVLAGPITGSQVDPSGDRIRAQALSPRVRAARPSRGLRFTALVVRGTEGGVVPSLRQSGKIWHYHDGGDEAEVDIKPADTLGIVSELRAAPLPEDLPGLPQEAGRRRDGRRRRGHRGRGRPGRRRRARAARPGPTFDTLVYGAALCLWHLGRYPTLPEAADAARATLSSGKPLTHLHA